jgi:hypothetical protein
VSRAGSSVAGHSSQSNNNLFMTLRHKSRYCDRITCIISSECSKEGQ